MKLENESTPTVSTGVTKSFAFAMEFNEASFRAYSSTTYTDAIRAVIRELSCNAKDAHVAAGNENTPFEIHLPTSHEPEFWIKDFGTGMDNEEIETLFAMYFGSNKRNSNRFIGALGIGSKSPFAVTDAYNVTSTKGGLTRLYAATVKNGMPHMEQVGETHVTPNAPNGVMVQFAVPEKDIWEFENKAKIALEFITPRPKMVNAPNFHAHEQTYIMKTDKWGLRKEARTAAHGYTARAIMGNVQYAVGEIDQSRTNSLQRKILEMPIDMFFPLGELNFATSREALQLTPKTIAAVLGMCDHIFNESIQTVKDKIDASPTLWEAQVMLFSLINNTSSSAVGGASMGGLISEALNKGKLFGKYKNFDFNEEHAVINTLAYNHIAVTSFTHNSRATKRSKKEPFFGMDQVTLRHQRTAAKTDPAVVTATRLQVTVEPKVMFIINDLTIPGDKYVHYHIQQSGDPRGKKVAYVIHKNERDTDVSHVVKNGKKLIADIGNPSITLMSELQTRYARFFAAVRTPGQSRKSRQIAVFKDEIGAKHRYTNTGWTKAWREATEDEMALDKKFYVVVDKQVATDTKFADAWKLEEFIGNVRSSGKFGISDDTPIFGVKRGHKVLKNNTGEYVELMTYVFSKAVKIMTPQKTLALSLYLKPFSDDAMGLLDYLAKEQPLTLSPVQQFAVALAEAKGIKESNWDSFRKVLDFCEERGKYTPGMVVDFNAKWRQIKAGYPMLEFVSGWHSNDKRTRPILVEYVKLVDSQNHEALAKAAASNS
jgi:hypothetical protein